jgi:MFS family permease
MLTMPVAGILTDKIGPGKIVMAGITTIVIGMAMFTQVSADTSYSFLLLALFVMGLGMGGTMMPIMTSALQTLKDHEIARGSTLMNITQQIAASIGTALFSVLLTNGFKSSELAGPAIASLSNPEIAESIPPAMIARGLSDAADAFGGVFVVATILVAVCLVPAFLLPRRPPAATGDGDKGAAPTAALMH